MSDRAAPTIDTSDLDPNGIATRAARHAALGDPVRLAMVDELAVSDRSPVELRHLFGLESNLLAHHLDVLERAGIVERTKSAGDGRRRYVRLMADGFSDLTPHRKVQVGSALFVCRANSARSQLAAAIWRQLSGRPARSAGTHPVDQIHPGAADAAKRAGLDLGGDGPRAISSIRRWPPLVVTVCDQAHEELEASPDWLHWSVPDPVVAGTRPAFDGVVVELRHRITRLLSLSGRAA